ncbi:MAG: hypothetical protein GXY83_43550 [Rhodopirellula sp.]|nr:hypothetical protein [Rhodopirellula sp.]
MTTPSDTVQISALITAETKARLEAYVREHGVKRSFLIERALQHHLAALEEVPADVVIPPALVVNRTSGAEFIERLMNPPPPTAAIRALIDDAG